MVSEKKIQPKSLTVQRMPSRAPATRIEWDVTVDVETSVDDLKNPMFWSHVSGATFHGPNNIVNVYWEDKSQLAVLYVRYYDQTSAKMEVLEHYVFDKASTIVSPDKYEVKWSGPNTKFKVIRLADGQTIKEGISSKEDAAEFIKNHDLMTK